MKKYIEVNNLSLYYGINFYFDILNNWNRTGISHYILECIYTPYKYGINTFKKQIYFICA